VLSVFEFGSTLGVTVTAVIIPVIVAALTAAAATLIARTADAANRRRDRYAHAVETLVAWSEFPYRVRRRTDDDPTTLASLAGLGHDLQQRLACHQAWMVTESDHVAKAYENARRALNLIVGPATSEAWNQPPVSIAAGMVLDGWGPGPACGSAIAQFQAEVPFRFGLRRLAPWRRPNLAASVPVGTTV